MTPNPQAELVAPPLHEELRLEASRVSVIDNRLAGRLMRMAEDAERMADRLTAAIDAMRKGWMPIETAPTDGTVVDLFALGLRIVNAAWVEENPAIWPSPNCVMSGWKQKGDHGPYRCLSAEVITHWMPIPPPPEKQA